MPITPVTGDVLVNTTTAGEQSRTRVERFADGSYIVVWQSVQEGEGFGVYFQRYNAAGAQVLADGVTLGAQEIHVNTTTSGDQFLPQVATLPDGKFVFTWSGPDDGSNDVFMQLYGSNGVRLGSEVHVASNESGRQAEPHIAVVQGGYIIDWASSNGDGSDYGVYAQRFDSNGNFVNQDGSSSGGGPANFQVNQTTAGLQGYANVLGLASGGALFTYSSPDTNAYGVMGRLMAADGTFGSEFHISSEAGSYQIWSEATQLNNGNIVVTWTSIQDGSGFGIYARIYSASGTPLGPEFLVNVNVGGNQGYYDGEHGPAITALADGGFAIAYWSDNGDGYAHAVFARHFDSAGNPDGGETLVNAFTTLYQYLPDIVATNDGFRVVWQSYTQDGDNYGIYQRDFDVSASPADQQIVRTGGEDQINVATTYNQVNAQVASFADGSYVVTWLSETALSTGDGSGWGIFAQRYNAAGQMISRDGSHLGADQFQINDVAVGDQGAQQGQSYNITALTDGRFVVTWDEYYRPDGGLANSTASSEGWDTYFRIFSSDGTATAAYRVQSDANISGEDAWPDVAALQGANAGQFVATYRTYYQGSSQVYDVWGQRFDSTGARVGSEFLVTQVNGANTSDNSEHQGRITGLANGGWVVVYQESGSPDTPGEGLFGRIYDANGNASDIFTVDTTRDGNQEGQDVALLAGGRFVVTWVSPDASARGIRARIFEANGAPVGNDFQVSNYFNGDQISSQVVGLRDGSFVVAFSSDESYNRPGGSNISLVRFDADGRQIGQEILVNRDISAGYERTPHVAATENGFVVTWDQSYAGPYDDGDLSGVFRQEFTIDGLNAAAGEAADAPTLTIGAIQGAEDSAIPISITAALNDAIPGTPESLHLEIGRLPTGATVSDGAGHTFTATAFAHGVDISGWTLSGLTITPPADRESDFTIEVRATALEPQAGSAFDSESVVVNVNVDVLPRPETVVTNAPGTRVNTYMAGEQLDAQIARAADGSYVVVWNSYYGQDGDNYGVFAQRYSSGGVPLGGEFQINQNSAGTQIYPQVAYLADGTFVVTWTSNHDVSERIYQRHFAADGTALAGDQLVNTSVGNSQLAPYIVGLSGGGYIIAWQSNSFSDADPGSSWGVFAQRYDASGNAVSRDGLSSGPDEFILNTTTAADQRDVQLAATAGGGFVAVWIGDGQTGDAGPGVFSQRFDSNGAPLGPELHVNQSTDNSQEYPVVSVLSNGNYVVSWHSNSNVDADGSSWGVFARLYDASGNPLTDEFLVNTYQDSEQTWPSIAALPGGGFAIAWQSYQQDGSAYGVYAQVFDAEGDKQGQEFWLSTSIDSSEWRPQIVATPSGDGLIAVWNSGIVDGDADGVVVRHVAFPTEPVYATGGERLVPTSYPHEQNWSQIATLSDGSYVVTWQSQPAQGVGDVSSWSVRAQHFAADGSPLGGEFTVNTNVAYDQSKPAISALDGGGYIVVWHSETGDGSGYGIYGQRFANNGTPIGSEFRINSATSGNQLNPDVTALHGAQAGGFAVSWQLDNNIYVRAFDASGTAIGGDNYVIVHNTPITGGDANEADARITGTTDGGFVVVWQDSDADGNGYGVIGRRYGISGGAVVSVTGYNSDGSTSPDDFRVNTTYYSTQHQPTITTLADGGYVVAFYNENAPGGAGISAQIYNANGTLRGHEFSIDGGVNGTQSEPYVTALSDGSFVVVWRDSRIDDAAADDVYGRRFDASGTLLNDFRVNSYGVGYQMHPVVTEVGDGFTVAWTSSAGRDGYGGSGDGVETYGVFQQHFTIDRAATGGNPIAQRPTLTVGATAIGAEDTAVHLNVAAHLNDVGGSETLSLFIDNVPVGATLSDGAGGHTFVATLANPSVNIAGWTLANLQITPPADYNGAFTLNLRAAATEATGDAAFNTATINVTVTPVDEVLPAYNAERRDNVQIGDYQYEPAVATRADGSYLVVWTAQGQAGASSYYSVMGQLHAADGTPVGTEFQLNTRTFEYAYRPEVVVLANGDYLVAYDGTGDGYADGVFAQRVSSTGVVLNIDGTTTSPAAVQLNTQYIGYQGDIQIIALADGGWVATWRSPEDGDNNAIIAHRYSATGVTVQMNAGSGLQDEVRINATATGDQLHPDVVQLANGSLAFTWQSPDNNGNGIFARILNADGTSTGEIQISSTATYDQIAPYMAALADGRAVIVWQSYGQDGSSYGIYGQVLNANGTLFGSEFRINSYSYDSQQEPQVAATPDGGFIVVWTSNAQDGSEWGVYGQRYDSAVHAVGSEFRINHTIPGDQSTPAIAVQPDGSGVIVTFEAVDGSGYGVSDIRLPLPDVSTPQAIQRAGLEQQVNVYTTSEQGYIDGQSVSRLSDGSYVVVWQSYQQDGSSWGVYARHFDADGDPIAWNDASAEMRVNVTTANDQSAARIAGLPDGGFVVVWHGYDSSTGRYEIYARHFTADGVEVPLKDASGTPVSGDFRISDSAGYDQFPSIAVGADGGFTIAFTSDRDGSGNSIQTHHFDATGQLTSGSDILVNQNIDSTQDGAEVAALAGGGYVTVWHSNGHDGSSWGVYGRMMDATGTPVGPEFLINTNTDSDQSQPDVAALTGGGFVVVWHTFTGFDTDDSGYGIAGQLYDSQGHTVGGEFQINGIARDDQLYPQVLAAQDGGFIVAWNSANADGNGTAVLGRRFDSHGVATEPYGNDFVINTYSAGDQSHPELALLERGFVAVWVSNGQDGSGNAVEMQRFEGAGLEPPPYVVDQAHGADSNSDLIFSTIQEAINAAPDGRTILIHAGTYNENIHVTNDDLRIVNADGEVVNIVGAAGSPTFNVDANRNITFHADLQGHLNISSAAGQDGLLFAGDNSGTILTNISVTAGAGGHALNFQPGQNGVRIEGSSFQGGAGVSLVQVLGGSGGSASTNVTFLQNTFNSAGGTGLYSQATGGEITGNVFTGTTASSGAALWLTGGGVDLSHTNTFQADGGPHFRDGANAYNEGTVLAQNGFPEGWARINGGNVIYASLPQAVGDTIANDLLYVSGGNWGGSAVTVNADNLTVSAPGGAQPATGINLLLGSGVTTITLADAAPIDVTGNGLANVINGNSGNNVLTGGAGNDTLVGAGGNDTLDGGADDDSLTVDLSSGVQTLTGGGGADTATINFTYAEVNWQFSLAASGATTQLLNNSTLRAGLTGVETVALNLYNGSDITIGGSLTGVSQINANGDGGDNVVDASAATTNVTFIGYQGNDTFIGGAGIDTVRYDNNGGNAVLMNLTGGSLVLSGVTVAAGTARDNYNYTDALSAVDRIITADGADVIYGANSGQWISTLAGADTVVGGSGDDTILGGAGSDSLDGGGGSDTISYIDNGAGIVATLTGAGAGNVVENGSDTDTFTHIEAISGTQYADTFNNNGSGAIRFVGLGGADAFNGSASGIDLVDYSQDAANGGAAAVTVDLTAGTATDGFGASDTLSNIDNVRGTAQADDLRGSAGANVLEGGLGADTLVGRGGNDTLDGGDGADRAVYFTGGPVTGMATRVTDGLSFNSATGGGSEGTDFLTNIEQIVFAGTDGVLGTSDDRTFNIVGGNIAVQLTADTGAATEAGGVSNGTAAANATGNVLSNDINLDQGGSDTIAVLQAQWTSATGPGTGSGTTSFTAISSGGSATINGRYGALQLASDGGYTYTPDATKSDLLIAGETVTETFTYQADDGSGNAATTTLVITLTGRNDAPAAVARSVSGSEDAVSLSGTLLATDADHDTNLTYALVPGSVQVNGSAAADGTVTVNSDGTYSYTTGSADQALDTGETRVITFNYVANDSTVNSAPATVTITVNGANDAPVAVAASISGSEDNATIGGTLPTATDVDIEPLTYSLVTGSVQVNGSAAADGTVTVNSDGTYSYTTGSADQALDTGETRVITFNYVANDSTVNSAPATVTITVNGANDAPVAVAASISGSEDNATIGGTLPTATDVDVEALTYALVTGSVKVNGSTVPDGTVTVNSDGTYSYTTGSADQALDTGETRVITFSYVANDGTVDSAPATGTITVNGANDAPVSGGATSISGSEDDVSIGGTLPTATDVDVETLTYALVAGSVQVNGSAAADNLITVNADGTYSYSIGDAQSLDTGESRTITFNYVANDGTVNSAPATVTITVNGANDAPVAPAATASGSEDSATVGGTLAATDVDVEALTYALVTGSVKVNGSTVPDGTVTVNSDGTYSYTTGSADQALDTGETRVITFSYVANDGTVDSAPATGTITVNGANDAPVSGGATSISGSEDDVSIGGTLPTATDVDVETLTYALVAGSVQVNGSAAADNLITVNADGTYSYSIGDAQSLDTGESRTITFNYVANDGTVNSAPAKVTITVNGANDAPVAGADSVRLVENQSATIDVRANDSDIEGSVSLTALQTLSGSDVDGLGTLTTSELSQLNAMFSIDSQGRVQFTPGDGLPGAESLFDRLGAGDTAVVRLTYTIQDSSGATTSAVLTVTVDGAAEQIPTSGGSAAGSPYDDNITGSSSGDLFLLQSGGDDTVSGGGGDDGFVFGAAFTAADQVDGGDGRDQLGLQGDYSGGLTLGTNSLINVEMLVLLSGHDARFGDTAGNLYSYNIQTIDSNVTPGSTLIVNFNTLLAGENVTFDGSAELDGTIFTYGGLGTDHLTGGQVTDAFYFGDGGRWGSSDQVDGQGGMDQLGLQGNYSGGQAVVFGADQIKNVESIVLLSGADGRFGGSGSGFSYDLTMNDANLASGRTMVITGNSLGATESLTFSGSAESNGSFAIYSGAGNDTLVGGALADDIWGGAGNDRIIGGGGADTLHGAAGNDTFVYLATSDSTLAAADQIFDFASGDKIDLSAIDAIAGGPTNETFSYIGSSDFTAAGQLRVYSQDNVWHVAGDINGDGMADVSVIVTTTDALYALSPTDFIL